MLQQTQVDRVIPYYKNFLKQFPTVHSLAKASLGDVLRAWQGLGYNRRAKMLHQAAQTIVSKHKGTFPKQYEELVALPGVGDYTAKAVRAFAFNELGVLIETNVRSVYIHHFFPKKKEVHDKEVLALVEKTLDTKNPRAWYMALMDYGAYLKKTMPNPSRKSTHHTKQKPFKGSNRQIRGVLLRTLNDKSCTLSTFSKLPFDRERIAEQLTQLEHEELVRKRGRVYSLP